MLGVFRGGGGIWVVVHQDIHACLVVVNEVIIGGGCHLCNFFYRSPLVTATAKRAYCIDDNRETRRMRWEGGKLRSNLRRFWCFASSLEGHLISM